MHRYLMSKQEVENKDLVVDLDEFHRWRANIKNYYTDICINFEDEITKGISKNIANLPKCLVDITRRHCKCQNRCLDYSLKQLKYDDNCLQFNTTGIDNDLIHTDCRYLGGPLEGDNDDYRNFFLHFSEDLYKRIEYYCNNVVKNFSEMSCKALVLRDYCNDDQQCIYYFLNAKEPKNCINKHYNSGIQNFKDILKLDAFENIFTSKNILPVFNSTRMNFIEKIRCRNLKSIEDYEDQEYFVEDSTFVISNKKDGLIFGCIGILLLIFFINMKDLKNLTNRSILLIMMILFMLGVYIFE